MSRHLNQTSAVSLMIALLEERQPEAVARRLASALIDLAHGDNRTALAAAELMAEGKSYTPQEAIAKARLQPSLFTH